MKKTIYAILLTVLLSVSATAQNKAANIASAETSPTVLSIDAGDGKISQLTSADLAKLPRRQIKAKDHDGRDATFSGVDLAAVLKLAGVKFGKETKGANLSSYLTVEAADKYRVVFAMTELDADFTDKIILLADARDGKPLSKEEGNLRLVVPDEKKQGRWARQVIKLTVRKLDLQTSAAAPTNKLNDEEAIREIVLKTIIKSSINAPGENSQIFYLAVDDDKDPSDDLLKKFGQYPARIKKVSESFLSAPDGDLVLDKITKKPGVIFSVSKITWKNNDEVTVDAGSYIGNMGSNGCKYTLKREKDEWKIVSGQNCFVS